MRAERKETGQGKLDRFGEFILFGENGESETPEGHRGKGEGQGYGQLILNWGRMRS